MTADLAKLERAGYALAHMSVEFQSVSKRFGERRALSELSFTAEPGKILGLLGPNGSGKTTTLRLILNLIKPDRGSVAVLGHAPSNALSDRIGYLPEERGLYRNMKVRDVIAYYSELKGYHPKKTSIDAWLERVDVAEYSEQRVQHLSKGTAQKVQLVATLLHEPELVILDEPFSGLDPLSRQQMRQLLTGLAQEGKTLLLSTHDMLEAESLCDAYLMLSHGRQVLDLRREELAERYGDRTVRLQYQGALPERVLDPAGDWVERAVSSGNRAELVLKPSVSANALLRVLVEHVTVLQFEVTKPSLHDLFLRLTRQTDSAT
jgi:ABC-2 type transport system ATP-binding protein